MQKLELTWIGKGQDPLVEPRILLHDESKDYGDKDTENMIIHGDNLLALKALEQKYTEKIKCIYIDPPYNTGEAFEEYNDCLEHSIWLGLMNSRLHILHNLLSDDGVIFVQLNDEEMNYCKVMMDEIFGRKNFINIVSLKTKNIAGASGGGEDKRLKKNVEFILVYAKNYESLKPFNNVYEETDLFSLIDEMKENGKSWKYTNVLISIGEEIEEKVVLDGSGDEIVVKKYKGLKRVTINQLIREGLSEKDAYIKYFDYIFSDTNAQSSIRQRIIDEFGSLENDEALIATYIPKTGRDKGQKVYHYYISPSIRRLIWLKDSAKKLDDNSIVKSEKLGTYWEGFNWNNVNKEGAVSFSGGKKPEQLVQRIIEMASDDDDIILDSFLGSGTTAAVAHKLNRRYIGIELGNHCYSLCLPRLQRVIDGEQTGISANIGWQGGGGFKFYELAPSLIIKDKYGNPVIDKDKYNPEMLAAAVAKLNGFSYSPNQDVFWKQGQGVDNSFIYVTTLYLTTKDLDEIAKDLADNERLLICAPAYDIGLGKRYENIDIKKIPQSVLNKCEYGVDNYNLNIIDVSAIDEGDCDSNEY